MNTDIRLSIDFWTHPKTVKLERRLGLEGVRSLQILWMWAARNRADGSLRGLDGEDIEIAADWRGEAGVFLDAVTKLGWLDQDEDGRYVIHDWADHNGWASRGDERGDKARFSRLCQVNPEEAERLRQQGRTTIGKDEYEAVVRRRHGDATATAGDLPAPAPAPAPSLKDTHSSPDGDGARLVTGTESEDIPPKPRGKARADACPHKSVIDLYHEILPECPHVEVWPEDCRRKLAARWREDKTRQELDWWRHVFRRVGQSDFLMGRVEGRGFVFSLTWFVEPKNFAKVLNGNYDNRAAPAGYSGGMNANAASNPGRQIGELTFA